MYPEPEKPDLAREAFAPAKAASSASKVRVVGGGGGGASVGATDSESTFGPLDPTAVNRTACEPADNVTVRDTVAHFAQSPVPGKDIVSAATAPSTLSCSGRSPERPLA
jgi:hypothetical protein